MELRQWWRRGTIAITSFLLMQLPAKADLLLYEPFDYTASTNLNLLVANGQNLAGQYTTQSLQDLVIADPGLTYGNLTGSIPFVAGNRLSDSDGVGAGVVTVNVDQDILIEPERSIFFSALFTFDDSLNRNRRASIHLQDDTNGDEIIFGQPGVGEGAIRIEADTAATGGLIADGADHAFIDGHTLLLLGRYHNSTEPTGDTLELLGYDTNDAVAVPSAFDPNDPTALFSFSLTGAAIDLNRISSIRFEIRGDNNNFIDELRIGDAYSDLFPTAIESAAPEASSAVFLLSGAALFLLARRQFAVGMIRRA